MCCYEIYKSHEYLYQTRLFKQHIKYEGSTQSRQNKLLFSLAIYLKNMQKEAISYTTEFHGHKTNLLNNAGMSQLLSYLNWVCQRIIMFIYNTIQLPNPQNLEKMCI